jgi:hypothetical protein
MKGLPIRPPGVSLNTNKVDTRPHYSPSVPGNVLAFTCLFLGSRLLPTWLRGCPATGKQVEHRRARCLNTKDNPNM